MGNLIQDIIRPPGAGLQPSVSSLTPQSDSRLCCYVPLLCLFTNL